MEVSDILQGGGIFLSGTAARWLYDLWVARHQKVELTDKYVTCDQCKAHREHIEKRIDTQTQMFAKVSDKLDMIEEHNEDRAKRMHDRLDPVIRQAAATGEAMKQHLEDHRAERSARQ